VRRALRLQPASKEAPTSELTLNWSGDLRFTTTTPSGHELTIDSHVTGEGAGPTPMELQLVALAGCGAMDVISVLRKMRQEITAYQVTVAATRAEEHPRVYRTATITHRVRGRGVREQAVKRAIALSMARYCPVYAMLHPTVEISERYEMTDETTGATSGGSVTPADAA